MGAHGFLVLDKPAGLSSARAIAPLKQRFGRKTKIGHAGTLDPFATGVLLVLVGDATRLSRLAMELPKTYRATVRFGRRTDTLDTEGEVVEERDPGAEPPLNLKAALDDFRGEILQRPPAFSALKVDGQRAYRLARKGEAPQLDARRVRIDTLTLSRMDWPFVELEIVCGAGTYIRSLARDVGERLAIPASLAALRRTAIGPFVATEGEAPLRPPMDLVRAAGMEIVRVDLALAGAWAAGRLVPLPEEGPANRSTVAVVTSAGEEEFLVGLGTVTGNGVQPNSVLADARRRLEEKDRQ